MNRAEKGRAPSRWKNALELDSGRNVVSGSHEALAAAIRRGADLRIYTEFRHNEHIDVESDNPELIEEASEFAVTYLVRDEWVAGIMSLRQPIELPDGFGSRPSMSFFLYNQNGQQAIARPYLDGEAETGEPGPAPLQTPPNMPKYKTLSSWDAGTNAPSNNFIYDFEVYRYYVRDDWQEVLAHDSTGAILSGSSKDLAEAAAEGCQLKVAVQGLCADFDEAGTPGLSHEVFVQAGPCYYYTKQELMITGSHPLVRSKVSTPMQYESEGWDFGWLMLRSDGHVVYRRCDPRSLKFHDIPHRYALRWFVR